MKRLYLFLLLPSTMLTSLQAQTLDSGQESWNERTGNESYNVGYHSQNPVWLTDNPISNYGVARVGYELNRGDFHAPDASGHTDNIDAYVGGLRHIGNFYLSGHIGYNNSSRQDAKWNSTLGVNPYNPFTLGDSISSDQTVEQFRMHAAGAYRLNDRWTLGLSLGLTTGKLSDQTDPRPETSSSTIPLTLGAAWQANPRMSIGLNAGVRFYRSDISHAIIDPLTNNVYFLMKGNGDYYRRSTADVGGYEREYKGNYFQMAAQLKYDLGHGKTDFFELSYESGKEKATDEGSTPFHGGDFKPTTWAFYNRLQIATPKGDLHHIILSGQYLKGNATWYDQKKVVDTDHGNRYYYQILSSYDIQETDEWTGQAEYRYEHRKGEQRSFFADATLGATCFNRKHFGTQNTTHQKANILTADLAAGKAFCLHKVNLETIVRAGYTWTLNDDFADASSYANDNIARAYSLPLFLYQTAKQSRIGCTVQASLPIQTSLTAGAYAKVDARFYADDQEPKYFDSTSLTTAEVGLFLHF